MSRTLTAARTSAASPPDSVLLRTIAPAGLSHTTAARLPELVVAFRSER